MNENEMEYIVVKAERAIFKKRVAEGLTERVNDLIKEGWRPIGGIGVGMMGSGITVELYQAMVRDGSGKVS